MFLALAPVAQLAELATTPPRIAVHIFNANSPLWGFTGCPAANKQAPRRLPTPHGHWFIGLSERNERRPPVGASHTGKKKKKKRQGMK